MHLLRGLDAIETALVLAPDEPRLRFNQALLLTEIGLDRRAADAWHAFLDLDTADGWQDEARAAQAALLVKSGGTLQAELRNALRGRDLSRLEHLVSESPRQDLLSFVEEDLLPAWASAEAAGDEPRAMEELALARQLGNRIHSDTGDAFVLDLVSRALGSPVDGRRSLAAAYAHFSLGRSLYDRRDTEAARRAFEQARRASPDSGPLDAWILYFTTLCGIWQNDNVDPITSVTAVRDRIDLDRHPILAGHLAWTRGFLLLDAGRFDEGLGSYREAHDLFLATGQGDAAWTVAALISDAFLRLGETRLAWEEALEAIRHADDLRNPRHLWAVWDQGARVASLLGHPETAAAFYHEAIEAAEGARSETTACNAYVNRATHLIESGRPRQALADLRHARKWAARIRSSEVRARMEAGILVAEARALPAGSETASIRRLSAAARRYERMRIPVVLPQIQFERARVHAKRGDGTAAEDDLRSALLSMDDLRQGIDEIERRVSFTGTVRPAIHALIELRLRDPLRAAVIPALTDLARDPAYFVPSTAVEQERLVDLNYRQLLRLEADEALLSATLLPDRLVLWVLRGGDVEVVERTIDATEVARRLAMTGTAPSPEDLAWFFDQIIRPLVPRLQGATRLFFVLDRGLNRLPIAALMDRETGRHLSESFAVSVVPAALVLADHERRVRVAADRVAILGSRGGEGLPILSSVEAEAERIGALYAYHRIEVRALDLAEFESMGRWADVLQFSGHAVSNPLAPSRSRLVTDSGPIYASRIREMDLARSKVIYLSACETALTRPDDSAGALSLAVAFLVAGADWVIASLWPIDDRDAREFSVRFHQELRNDPDPMRALQRTQQQLLRLGYPVDRWGGYQLIHG